MACTSTRDQQDPPAAVASPIIAGIAAMIATYLAYRISRRATEAPVTSGSKHDQVVSASLVSLAQLPRSG
jgi:PiT family inorganic phosphate transporter